MHRATPLMTSFRSYVGGGARALIDQIDDSKLLQEMAGGFMKGEARKGVESPQNYGFSSVVMDAEKDAMGKITSCAEGFMSFLGGNRSLPICGVMDDRRHRIFGMEKGDVAMFRTRDDTQQFHMTKDGGYWSGPTDKTVRMQLVDKQQDQQQGAQSGSQAGGGGQQQGQQGQQGKGQKPVYKNGQKSYRFCDITKDASRLSGNEAHLMLSDGDSYVHCVNKKTYLGANASRGKFDKVITLSGPAVNTLAKIGGGGGGGGGGGAITAEFVEATVARSALAAAGRTRMSYLAIALALVLGASLGVNCNLLARGPVSLASACLVASR
jgi:hypothetical protein